MKKPLAVKCITCKNLIKTIDKKGWVRYSCQYAPNIEWLGGYCREPLNNQCGHYDLKKITYRKIEND